jgi:O-antigen ligase
MLNSAIKNLWKLFLFSFPFPLHFVLYEKASYRFGNFSPWVTGFLFLPEILLGLIFVLWFADKLRRRNFKKFQWPDASQWLLKLFALNAALVSVFFGDSILFLFFALHLLVGLFVYTLIKEEYTPHDETIKWLLYGAAFQIVIAYLQTRLNGSVGLPILGEPVIGPDILNVAKTDLAEGVKQIRPYGTFLHPNILGAYLMTVLFTALPYLKKVSLPFWVILLTVGIYLTGSQAAQLATAGIFVVMFIFGILKKPFHKRWVSLGVLSLIVLANAWLFVNSAELQFRTPSISERLQQNIISSDMFFTQPWGVGIGNFTLEMENFASAKLLPWEFQPVHNAYFLILNETGAQGLLVVILLIAFTLYRYWKKEHAYSLQDKIKILPFMSLLVIASFDHLLWTSYIGMILIGLVVAETTRSP